MERDENQLTLPYLGEYRRPSPLEAYDVLFGHESQLRDIRQTIERISAIDEPVLITGETGTGKDLLARIIHLKSSKSHGPFIKVNCVGKSQRDVEDELFGFEKGVFKSAPRSKPGKFELSRGGTLFLDIIEKMEIATQARVLEVLENGRFFRFGGKDALQTNARVIAASNINLEEKVRDQIFRKDLFDRLNTIRISIPPLRERKKQVPTLVDYFSLLFSGKRARFSEKTIQDLTAYDWPENIRELENSVRRLVHDCLYKTQMTN
jgi:two-component system NtrC family response regulator